MTEREKWRALVLSLKCPNGLLGPSGTLFPGCHLVHQLHMWLCSERLFHSAQFLPFVTSCFFRSKPQRKNKSHLHPVHLCSLRMSMRAVCLGCYNKSTIELGGLNNKHLFLAVLEAGSPRSGQWQIRCLV